MNYSTPKQLKRSYLMNMQNHINSHRKPQHNNLFQTHKHANTLKMQQLKHKPRTTSSGDEPVTDAGQVRSSGQELINLTYLLLPMIVI